MAVSMAASATTVVASPVTSVIVAVIAAVVIAAVAMALHVARGIFMVVPVILDEIDALATGVIAAAVFFPVFGVARRDSYNFV